MQILKYCFYKTAFAISWIDLAYGSFKPASCYALAPLRLFCHEMLRISRNDKVVYVW
ncbi:MAG: hypothetical protein IJT33_04125 [Campylobacter sp.]|nr:hypothetical protein [Campylobacter sp.]MBR0071720.1 hypothetical protein [Campylobacter sp.]